MAGKSDNVVAVAALIWLSFVVIWLGACVAVVLALARFLWHLV